MDNADDLLGLYAHNDDTAWIDGDSIATFPGNISQGAVSYQYPRWCGGYTWGSNKYWILTTDSEGAGTCRFYVSNDAITWTLQYTFSGISRFISGWPYDGEYFYAAQDGTTAPLLISDDRGESWQAQTGNWATICAALGDAPDIYCLVPVFTE